MRSIDRIKLNFTRNWKLPGKERLSNLLKPSGQLRANMYDGIVWLNDEDIAIYTTADNYIECTLLSLGTYENEINKLIRLSLKIGENALDIGCNIGLQSLRMSQCVAGNGKVYAFEPLIYLQEKCKKNILLNKADNITLFPYALSDGESVADFSIDRNLWNQGTFSLNNKPDGPEKQVVNIKIGDNLSEIQQLTSLALIKIDVEGFEYQVLRGLKQTLQKHRPRIIFEYDEHYWVDNGQNIGDCYAFLQILGYTLYQITSAGCQLLKNPANIAGGNVFCMPEQK